MEPEPKPAAAVTQREPVRVNVLIAAFVVAASTFLGGLALVDVITAKVAYAAGSAALSQFALIAFAGELARSKAYAPSTVDEIMDADAVITAAENAVGNDGP